MSPRFFSRSYLETVLRLRGLSRIPAIQNFLLHWILTLLVMWGCARFETWPRRELVEVAKPWAAEGVPVRRERQRFARGRDHGVLEPDTEV